MNMTPMIDCVFQLIIFFVCSMDMSSKNFDKNIKLAEAPTAPVAKTPAAGTVYINLTNQGIMRIGTVAISAQDLRNFLTGAVNRYGNQFPVVIRAQWDTPHVYVKSVMNILANCKVININFHAYTHTP